MHTHKNIYIAIYTQINLRFLRWRRYNNTLYRIYYIYTRLLVAKDVGVRIPGPMSTGNRHHRSDRAGGLVRDNLLSIFTTATGDRFFLYWKFSAKLLLTLVLWYTFAVRRWVHRPSTCSVGGRSPNPQYILGTSRRSGSWRWLWWRGRGLVCHLILFSVIALRNYTATIVVSL